MGAQASSTGGGGCGFYCREAQASSTGGGGCGFNCREAQASTTGEGAVGFTAGKPRPPVQGKGAVCFTAGKPRPPVQGEEAVGFTAGKPRPPVQGEEAVCCTAGKPRPPVQREGAVGVQASSTGGGGCGFYCREAQASSTGGGGCGFYCRNNGIGTLVLRTSSTQQRTRVRSNWTPADPGLEAGEEVNLSLVRVRPLQDKQFEKKMNTLSLSPSFNLMFPTYRRKICTNSETIVWRGTILKVLRAQNEKRNIETLPRP